MSAGSTHGIAGAAGARGGTVSALGTVVFPEAETSTGGPASRDVGAVQHSVQHGAHALPRRTHAALLRPVLYAGVERTVIALESTIAIGLVATVGPRLVTLAAVAVIVGLVHPVMAWVTSKDPLATAIYIRSLGWRDYYAAHAPAHAALRARNRARARVKPTLPRL